jgi:hypothetical protein
MLFLFPTQGLIRHQWQFKTIVFLHRCIIHAALLLRNATVPSVIMLNVMAPIFAFFGKIFDRYKNVKETCLQITV